MPLTVSIRSAKPLETAADVLVLGVWALAGKSDKAKGAKPAKLGDALDSSTTHLDRSRHLSLTERVHEAPETDPHSVIEHLFLRQIADTRRLQTSFGLHR